MRLPLCPILRRLFCCLPVLPILAVMALGLAGCDTTEEQAEKHYARGMALLEAGDTDRALLEFRNVFRLDNAHVPALSQYAAILEEKGDVQGAAKHYLRVVELDPHNFDAHLHLAGILIQLQDFPEAEIHVSEALRLSPEDPRARALRATVDFRNDVDRAGAVARAQAVVDEAPDVVAAHMVLVADRLNAKDNDGALARVDAALDAVPGNEGLHLARLSVLEEKGDIAAIGEQLIRMTALFPDNRGVRDALIQWHLREGDIDAAEAALRDGVKPGDRDAALEMVQFLYELRGPGAALAELDRLIEGSEDPRPYQRTRAGIDFTEGREDVAIAALRTLLVGAEPSAETRDTRVMLAGMLADTGAARESGTLVETVLAEERGDPGALKLRARSEIAAGDPDAAIRDMRLALVKAPEDPEIMTIMAQAYEQAGSRELMGERLALAVEVSNNGVAESLRYATYLMQEGRPGSAADILRDALREAQDDPEIWHMLGRIAVDRHDWDEAARITERLRTGGDPRAMALAADLEAGNLEAQDGSGLLAGLLASMTRTDGPETDMARTVTARMSRGDMAGARDYLDGILQGDPVNVPAHLLLAGIHATADETARAEALYREAITAAPADTRPYEALVVLLADQGREADAASVAREGLEAAGPSAQLQLTLAGIAETEGNIPQAIALYEAIHDTDPDNLVAANNLASLLTADIATDPAERSPEDTARLERASGIAQGLKEIAVPPLQDTYGWILFLEGDAKGARAYLEPAAQALAESAQAQYHLAEAAFALQDREAAEAGFTRALEAQAAGSPLPQAEIVHARLAELAKPEAQSAAAAGEPDDQGN